MAVDVYAALKSLIDRLLGGDRQLAVEYAEDPYGTLTGAGITDGDLSKVDMYQLVGQSAQDHGAQQVLQHYGPGVPAPANYQLAPPPAYHAQQSAQDIVQHLNYVTYAQYEGDEYITQQLLSQHYDYSTSIDNSVDNSVNVDGTVHGDIDTTSVYAAAGGTAVNVADSPVVIDSNFNTGDNVAQAGGDQDRVIAGERNQQANVDVNTSGGDGTGGAGGNAASGNAQGGNALGGFGLGGNANAGDGGDGQGGFAFGDGGDGGDGGNAAFVAVGGDGGDGGNAASANGYGGDGGDASADGIGGAADASATSGDASADGGAGYGGAGGAVGPINISFGSQDDADTAEEYAAGL